ncbi:MAG: GNAT family N-acetyltransferase [Solirubrobacteraceae bacterium]
MPGQGTVMHASCALLNYAFAVWKLNRVEIRAATGNVASRRVAERLGLVPEGCWGGPAHRQPLRGPRRLCGARQQVDGGRPSAKARRKRPGRRGYASRRPWAAALATGS